MLINILININIKYVSMNKYSKKNKKKIISCPKYYDLDMGYP